MRSIGASAAAFFTCLAFVHPASADDCKLMQLTSVDFTMDEQGDGIFVPVSIAGQSRHMLIDTGSPSTAIDPQTVQDLGIVTHRIFQGQMFDSAGKSFQYMADIHGFVMGTMHADEIKALVWPSQMWNDREIAGTIGADMLGHYDIDLDFAARKFGLFSQDHCPGKVVYWPNDGVAVIPIHVVSTGHIIVPVVLDGHPIDAVLDTGSYGTILTLEGAKNYFGLDAASPGMTQAGHRSDGTPVYTYPFKKLELEGITIANPEVHMWRDELKYGIAQTGETGTRISSSTESNGKTDLTLGMSELRNLHIYIAYKEQKLYITAGNSPPVAATKQSTGAAAGTSSVPH
jgi:predicted aspartyl protease